MSILTVPTITSRLPPRFYTSQPLRSSQVGTTIVLPGDAAHHAVRVLRLGPGDGVTLFDGTGGEYAATLVETGKRTATASIDRFDPVERESPIAVTLVQAVIAADAMDFAIRKAVELGAWAIAPVLAARSQASLAGGRGEKRVQHWRGIAIAACEQCGRNRVPAIAPLQTLSTWLHASADQRVAIAAPGATTSLAAFASEAPPTSIIVGPEGGFTDDERALAADNGATAVSLGPRVLRAETAGVAALAMLAALVGDAR